MSIGSGKDFIKGPIPPGKDRRAASRNLAVVGRAWLGWRRGKEFLVTPAFVLNISMDGCLVAAQEGPPSHGAALLRLDGPILPVWFEAKILEVRGTETSIRAVRLHFTETCPYELFMAVAYGQANRDASGRRPDLSRSQGNVHP